MDISATLAQLVGGRALSSDDAEALFEILLTGGLDQAQIGAVLALIQARGATSEELVGAARVMRHHVTRVPVSLKDGQVLIDTCGTGGAPKVFNVSTVAAIVVAAAGGAPDHPSVLVAKHGNRSRTGRGSAEVLEKLGINVHASPEAQGACLSGAGVCFCFAINHHPAMRHAASVRKSLGFRTIFNLLGPLTNPAGATRQLIGVYDDAFVDLVAQTLALLGVDRAMVVHAADGLDELTVTAPTRVAHVVGTQVSTEEIDPAALGLAHATIDELCVDDVERSADLIRAILAGEPGPARDMVALSTAGALIVAGAASDWASGLAAAYDAIDSGRARDTLERLARRSHV